MNMTEIEIQEAVVIITSMRKCLKTATSIIDPEMKKRIDMKQYKLKLKSIEQDHTI
ncbi:hypothetical protein [Aliivibrio salmonicida]|uniref:hypothetical protein n=1 Tax=Aliivibrio salmonicida TaxID=40269 RepID=UPI003D11ED57